MHKEFVPYNTIRNNALKLAYRIYKDGFIPDIIYVSLRGGAYMGNVISEYFKFIRGDDKPVFYAAVVARSYTDISTQEAIRIDGWTYSPDFLRGGDKVLLVDDVYDSGRTINYLTQVIMQRGLSRDNIKVAVHDYKVRDYAPRPSSHKARLLVQENRGEDPRGRDMDSLYEPRACGPYEGRSGKILPLRGSGTSRSHEDDHGLGIR